MKICPKCKTEKETKEFNKNKNSKDGMQHYCRKCTSKKEEFRNGFKKCKVCKIEKRLDEFGKKKNGRCGVKSMCKKCYKIYLSEYNKKYRIENGEKVRAKYRNSDKTNRNKKYNEKMKNDINFRILVLNRHRIRSALKNTNKLKKTIELLGCTIEELKSHIEKQFLPGMNWENWSYRGWHLDHIRPCASFDLTDPEQQKICFHYTNLQPLWGVDNMRKWANF